MPLPHIDTWIHGDHDIMPDAGPTKRQRQAIEDERREQIKRDTETEEHGNGTRSDTKHGQE